MPRSTPFTMLRIQNAPTGSNGPVTLDSGIGSDKSVVMTSGRITRTVNLSGAEVKSLRSVAALIDSPELYYVNLSSGERPAGLMRGQLQRDTLRLRPSLSPSSVAPAVTTLDAQAEALLTLRVHRDTSGVITSGMVMFEVNYL